MAERGYAQMCEMLDTFGSREAWQEAYIEEFRQVRIVREAAKAWSRRNWIGFYNGIQVTPEGYVPLKAKRQHLIHLRCTERHERQAQRIRAEEIVKDRKLRAKQRAQAGVQRLMTEALAESLAVEMTWLQTEGREWRTENLHHLEVR